MASRRTLQQGPSGTRVSASTISGRRFLKLAGSLICVAVASVLLGAFDTHQIDTSSSSTPTTPSSPTQMVCGKHDGYIIANMNGRLANNLFQIALANRLSQDLCWPIIFKEGWQGVFPTELRATQCFPHALRFERQKGSVLNTTSDTKEVEWLDTIKIDEATNHFWTKDDPAKFFQGIQYRQTQDLYDKWRKESEDDGTSLRLGSSLEYEYSETWDTDLMDYLRKPEDSTYTTNLQQDPTKVRRYDAVRTIHLDAFFIHYNWMQSHMDSIRQWLRMNVTECCHHLPPENAVVLHVRNFQESEELNPDFLISVYTDVLDRYYFASSEAHTKHNTPYVLWIVCQPGDVDIDLIKELKGKYDATVVTGNDPYDAFCTLQHAKDLILSTHSTFSQMAALLAPNNNNSWGGKTITIHYLLPVLRQPKVTLVVPHWHYHLVEPDRRSIEAYDIDVSTIQPIIS